MVKIKDAATVRRLDASQKARPKPSVAAVGAVDQRGWPKTDRESLPVNLELIWHEAKRRVVGATHHRVTLGQALALADREIVLDKNVPLEDYRHSLGVLGPLSMAQVLCELWPQLPEVAGNYTDMSETQRQAYGVRQRLGVSVRRSLLGICVHKSGNSTWWVRDEVDGVIVPPRTSRVEGNTRPQPKSDESSSSNPDPQRQVVSQVGSVEIELTDPTRLAHAVAALAERAALYDQVLQDNERLRRLVDEQKTELERLGKVRDLFELMKSEV